MVVKKERQITIHALAIRHPLVYELWESGEWSQEKIDALMTEDLHAERRYAHAK